MFTLMSVLIERPFLALIPAAVFALVALWTRRPAVVIAALLWAGYSAYEYGMKVRLLCSGECNIRVDLLLIYPLLVIVSAAAVVVAIRHAVIRRPTPRI